MPFPQTRLRRLRATGALRGLVRETDLSPADFVYPMFVAHGIDRREPIEAMPGVDRLSIAHAVDEAGEAKSARDPGGAAVRPTRGQGRRGLWAPGTTRGSSSSRPARSRRPHPDLLVIADLCLCEYTSHGHCGVVQPDGTVDNDATLELLARTAVSQARAGADIVAPSDMMDGRVGVIRAALDDDGLADTPILAYSAKFASAFYGPVPRGGGLGAGVRRPPRLPDGPGQRRRGGPRDAARRRGGRRHRDGQAGAAVPRPDPSDQGRRPRCRWPPTTSAASTRWSRRRPPPAIWTSAPPCSRR